ncbi:O-antigen ligase family protein [Flagellimonas marinaquae]|uniref:O-antigen ligase family protein n=1 Tax=Flagellimonas marinaquae TaxID=254955 RepID=UPI0020758A2B|nr:O-antigen ligase family protein [Allomuricauda aquimarina]USD24822.1 O-antigen ligase family protein [Allomuricauda aquimarina]
MAKTIRYIALALMLLNLPSFFLAKVGSGAGGLGSALMYAILLVYSVIVRRVSFLGFFIILGLSYFLISGVHLYSGEESAFIYTFIKFMIVVVFGAEAVRYTTKKEMFYLLLIGAMSIVLNATFFGDSYGRYSGFYLDPNAAGFICITGFALTFGLNKSKIKLLGQFIFSLAGFFTFSRTFILLWVILILISLIINAKNIKIALIGFVIVTLLISFSSIFKLNTVRFNQLKSIVSSEEVSTNELGKGSRTTTWSYFYDYIYEKPVFGNGYGSFQGRGLRRVGPHNSFLLVIGESGIFPFIVFIGLYGLLIFKGIQLFRERPYLLMMGLGQFLFLLTSHNYFTSTYLILSTMWIYIRTKELSNAQE